MNHEKWLKGFKFAAASVIAIALANLFGLKYATTAGIITILSIQNTKRETIKIAARRTAAYVCALGIAAISFAVFGFTIPAFAVYLFLFSCICLFFGWPEAISMCSVLVSHFLTEQGMGVDLLMNESLLFVIGAGMGILANLHLHRKADEFDELAQHADKKMCAALETVKRQLVKEADTAESQAALKQLDVSLQKLQECAHRNWNNTLFGGSAYETDYADMRCGQAQVLEHIVNSASMLEVIPKQAEMVAGLLEQIHCAYHRDNTVAELLQQLQDMYMSMRQETLPQTREEFEARAVLFYVLKQVEEFLLLKRKFALAHKLGA